MVQKLSIDKVKIIYEPTRDMLSRIKPESGDVCTLDWVDPYAYADEDADKNLPILHDGLDLIDVSLDQQVEFVDELCDAEVQDRARRGIWLCGISQRAIFNY